MSAGIAALIGMGFTAWGSDKSKARHNNLAESLFGGFCLLRRVATCSNLEDIKFTIQNVDVVPRL
jgi:hypothetical protein